MVRHINQVISDSKRAQHDERIAYQVTVKSPTVFCPPLPLGNCLEANPGSDDAPMI